MPRQDVLPRRLLRRRESTLRRQRMVSFVSGSRLLSLACLLLACLLLAQSAVAQQPLAWKVRDLVRTDQPVVELQDPRNRPVGRIAVQQLVYIYSVMTAIEEAAEISADLYLVPGSAPNAFAGAGNEGENIVGINFGMLEVIGKDVHAAAAILGHELAHLKLDHRADLEKARSRGPSSVFSASDTKYSRDNEREADYLGMIWTIEAGYDPEGAVRVHQFLYDMSKRGGKGFSGSHPSTIERITVLKSLARRLGR